MFRESDTSTPAFHTTDEESRKSPFRRVLAILCAILITLGVMLGYAYLRWRHAERLKAEEAALAPPPKPSLSPLAQVFVDDAMIKGAQVVIGGTIQNISSNKMTGITVDLELKRRKDGGLEVRTLTLEPSDLDPSQQGRYALIVPSHEYRESRVQRIKIGQTSADVPFKILPGAQRPPERLPSGKTIIVKPSPKRTNGEEFINTPDNPVRVP
jgi:hypothetical protein